jgi:DNA-binding response OmpR family regulator
MTLPLPKPVDDLLFDAVHIHSMRTRGQTAKRVTVEYLDGSETTLALPARSAPSMSASDLPEWPPGEGWAFRAGEAAFNGFRFKLAGKLLGILRALAEHKGEPVAIDRLKRKVWDEEPHRIDDSNVQGHISQLRKRLREELGMGSEVNPISHADGSYRLTVY